MIKPTSLAFNHVAPHRKMRNIKLGTSNQFFVEFINILHVYGVFHLLSALRGSIHRGSYMSAHVLLNLLNKLGIAIKCEACRAFYSFFATSLINSIIQKYEC